MPRASSPKSILLKPERKTMNATFEIFKSAIILLFFLGIIIYSCLMLVYVLQACSAWRGGSKAVVALLDNGGAGYTFGLPLCAVTAFAIVCVLERLSPSTASDGKLEFKAFGAVFSGPAGPVTLWVVCYLTLVASTMMISKSIKSDTATSTPTTQQGPK
jgi:hypothetical protein